MKDRVGPCILSAAKNLVLYRGVASFSWTLLLKESSIWVLRDEILRCAQNDKDHSWVLISEAVIPEIATGKDVEWRKKLESSA